MFVESAQNFEVLKEINFSLFGMGPKYRRRAERMKPDDRVLFYVKGLRKWPASATIASTYFEDDSPLWSPTTRNESFQYRVKLRADIVLDEEDYIDALLLAPQLEYIKRWVPEDWPLAFWDRLHLLRQADFRLIEGEMQRIASNKEPVPRDNQRDGGPSSADGAEQTEADLGHRPEPSERVDDDEGESEVVSYPSARPEERQGEPDRPSGRLGDDEGESEVVSYPSARPEERQGEPDRPSGRLGDDEGEPEVISYPSARPEERQGEPDRPSGRVDDEEGETGVITDPSARPEERRGEPDRPSGRVEDEEGEPEVISYPAARPEEWQGRPGYPGARPGERRGEPDRPSRRVDDDEDEPEVISYPAARPDEGQGEPDRPSGRVDGDEGEPEILSDPPDESVADGTKEE